jgi:histidinol-phosphate/aromatic aminotransferase/cobyric acid decarboxylase-like protein
MYEIFENDENVLAAAQNGDDKIIFVTCEQSAMSDDKEMEALPTFDDNTVIVAISGRIFDKTQGTPDEFRELLADILAKGTMLAEEVFAARS